ncbi:MAG TPA: (4Fe-4S)-binding protein, partial [Dehalococcoidia bacterium]|nr:(4Fe-4S)-binding protein [Dehalococcoidia bacterium]
IRCGACLNACPVYRKVGGHAYGWVYPGPIGAIVSPVLTGLKDANNLPNASSLCGACHDACPVKINIPRMLLELRYRTAEGSTDPQERTSSAK